MITKLFLKENKGISLRKKHTNFNSSTLLLYYESLWEIANLWEHTQFILYIKSSINVYRQLKEFLSEFNSYYDGTHIKNVMIIFGSQALFMHLGRIIESTDKLLVCSKERGFISMHLREYLKTTNIFAKVLTIN